MNSLLSQNWAPSPGMKSWHLAITRPDRRPRLSHSPSNKPPQCREGRFNKVVTGLLGLPGPINLTCSQYKSKLVHQAQNDVVLNWDRRWLPPWNLGIATTLSSPFPSEWSTFHYLPHPVTMTNININIYSSYPRYPSSSWNKDPTCEWDQPLDFYRWLSTKHSKSSHIKVNTSIPRIHKEGYYHATYQHHPRTQHVVHNTSHVFKVKQTQYFISIGIICSRACPAHENVRICDASWGFIPSSTATTSFSCRKPPVMIGLHAMTCTFYLIKWFKWKLN
jgi:hypothetical protein